MAARPRFHVSPFPHFAHVKLHLGPRPVGALDELLDPLAADAEHPADLGRSDEMVHSSEHSLDDSSHLTIGQEYGRLVT